MKLQETNGGGAEGKKTGQAGGSARKSGRIKKEGTKGLKVLQVSGRGYAIKIANPRK